MKKIKDWLNELPEPYRSQAIENSRKEDELLVTVPADSMEDSLMRAFCWYSSPQGDTYWRAIALNPPKQLPPISEAQQECIYGQNSDL